jgi:Zn finger protein HypA/HybF involved in hydrogenase expression
MLGDKAVLRTPILGLTPEWPANAKCLSCEHVFTTHFKHGIIRCPACDSNQDSGQARENHTRSC